MIHGEGRAVFFGFIPLRAEQRAEHTDWPGWITGLSPDFCVVSAGQMRRGASVSGHSSASAAGRRLSTLYEE